jgi:hypothetical protein
MNILNSIFGRREDDHARIEGLLKRDVVFDLPFHGHRLLFERIGTAASAARLVSFIERGVHLAENGRPVEIWIVAGEATHEEYFAATDALKRFLAKNNNRLFFAAGPVLSGLNGHSVVLEIAQKYPDNVELFILPTRAEEHWKVLRIDGKPDCIQLEHPHVPVPEHDCFKCTITGQRYLFGELDGISFEKGKERQRRMQMAFETLSRETVDWFERHYRRQGFRYDPKSAESPPVLPTERIRKAYYWMKERGASYDALGKADILACAELAAS